MRTYDDPARLRPEEFRSPVVAVGVFDGMHVGHRRLLAALRDWAAGTGGETVVVTFRSHPRTVITESGATFITSLPHRLLMLERERIDACVLLTFSPELARMSAQEFARDFLIARLGLKGLLMGFDSRLGRGGGGNLDRMRELGRQLGFEVRQFQAVKVDDEVVSSTRIRELILAGKLARAQRMLDRPVAVLGTVVKGEGRGRDLGFPTANLDLHHEARPPSGVYAATAVLEDEETPALVNIGTRPTFHAGGAEVVEVHIPGFDGELYGRDIEVLFLAKIREERSFASTQELIERMKKDAQELKRLLRQKSTQAS